MARIPLLHDDTPGISAQQRATLESARQQRGTLLNVYRAMANRPEAARAFSGMVQTVYRSQSTLEPKHGELAYLTATAVNDCYY